jgi:L-ectoine synthase
VIVRNLKKDILGTDREVKAPQGQWTSRRLSLREDGMGFSFHDTLIHAGTETYIWYKHHLEAVYCVGGRGEIEDLSTGEIHPISDGTIYLLNGHEKHLLRAEEEMRMICAFNPPLRGDEVHNAQGFYELPED